MMLAMQSAILGIALAIQLAIPGIALAMQLAMLGVVLVIGQVAGVGRTLPAASLLNLKILQSGNF